MALRTGGEMKDILEKEEMGHMCAGFTAVMTESLSEEDQIKVLSDVGPALNEEMIKRVEEKKQADKAAAEVYLQSYLLQNPRAKQSASGLIYHEIIIGMGKQATPGSTVTCHYTGTLPDGTVFDSSVTRGEPLQISLGQVIPAWQEGIPFMQEGGKAELICPPSIAYGERGSPPVIPPNATLKFEIELIKVH
jgi:FKBP-type peptidyl-prolyl cis-trans isomerase FkpA